MDDQRFDELQLRIQIAPSQSRWPTEFRHFQLLHRQVDYARNMLTEFRKAAADIDRDRDLSHQGRGRKKARLAMEFIAKLEDSDLPKNAAAAVEDMQRRWGEKQGAVLQGPKDFGEAALHSEIRRHIAHLDDKGKRIFIE